MTERHAGGAEAAAGAGGELVDDIELRMRMAVMMDAQPAVHAKLSSVGGGAEQAAFAALQRNISDVSTGPLMMHVAPGRLGRIADGSQGSVAEEGEERPPPQPQAAGSSSAAASRPSRRKVSVLAEEVRPWPRASITVGSDCSDDASAGPSSPVAARRKMSERVRYVSTAIDDDVVSLPRAGGGPQPQHRFVAADAGPVVADGRAFVLRDGFHQVHRPRGDAAASALPTDQGDFAANLAGDWMFPRVASEELLVRKPPKIVNGYLFGELLGEGSYGKVKECLHQDTLIRYAIKIFKQNRIKKIPNGFANVDREIRLLRRLKHINLVNMRDVFWVPKKQKWYMVLDYCVCSLQEMIDNAPLNRLPVFQAHYYFVQLVDGLEYLHGQRVIHKDVKPGNLLLARDECLKISDLGVAEDGPLFRDVVWCHSGQGTPKFQSPEIAAGKEGRFRGEPVDIWAAGVTLYNMLSGEHPFDGAALLPLYNDIATRELAMPTSVHLERDASDLLHGMLTKEPERRMAVGEIRRTDWYRRRHCQLEDKVQVPVKNDDPLRSLTVYPYLEQLYGGELSHCDSVPSTSGVAAASAAVDESKRPAVATADGTNSNGNCPAKDTLHSPLTGSVHRSSSSRLSHKAAKCRLQ